MGTTLVCNLFRADYCIECVKFEYSSKSLYTQWKTSLSRDGTYIWGYFIIISMSNLLLEMSEKIL